jgi:hypothetical protein
VRTSVVTAADNRDRHAADTRELPHLLHITAENFNVREISADKAYSSHANFGFARQYDPLYRLSGEHHGSRAVPVGKDVRPLQSSP